MLLHSLRFAVVFLGKLFLFFSSHLQIFTTQKIDMPPSNDDNTLFFFS